MPINIVPVLTTIILPMHFCRNLGSKENVSNRAYKNKFLFASIIPACFFLMCSGAKTGPEESAIRTARQQFNDAIARHDSSVVAFFCTDDYTAVSSRNFEIKGAEGERAALAKEFRTKKQVVYIRTPVQIEVFEAWNMASESGQWTGQWEEADGTVKLSGTYYAKWHKVKGTWKIRAEVFTPLTCTGSKFCNQSPL
jgi:ketosteroid isomerase-like protein